MLPLKQIFSARLRAPKPSGQVERPTFEQMKEVIELAEEFDKLQSLPVWEKVIRQLGTEVQADLMEATKFRYEPVRQTAHVVRWDAKRELLDALLSWIDATQAERTRITEEFRAMKGES